jgi:hypothetical protein
MLPYMDLAVTLGDSKAKECIMHALFSSPVQDIQQMDGPLGRVGIVTINFVSLCGRRDRPVNSF